MDEYGEKSKPGFSDVVTNGGQAFAPSKFAGKPNPAPVSNDWWQRIPETAEHIAGGFLNSLLKTGGTSPDLPQDYNRSRDVRVYPGDRPLERQSFLEAAQGVSPVVWIALIGAGVLLMSRR